MAVSVAGQYNTYIANHEATQGLITDFSRNPDKFKLAQWAQYIPVEKNRGHYIEMTVEMAGRIRSTSGADREWPDGNEAPSGVGNLEQFEFQDYRTHRYAFPYSLGQLAVEQASWDVLAQHGRIWAQNAMTLRTQRATTVATTAANYLSGMTIDIDAEPAGLGTVANWDAALETTMDIKRTLDYAFQQIQLQTLSSVSQADVNIILNPDLAAKMANSQEIRATLKQSPYALDQVLSNLDGAAYSNYGLPRKLYGYNVVVEDTVKVTTQKNHATPSRQYVWPDGVCVMASRPGGLDGQEGAPSFSTFGVLLNEEMTVESKHDIDNRRHMGRVVDDFDVKMIAPVSGVYIYNALT